MAKKKKTGQKGKIILGVVAGLLGIGLLGSLGESDPTSAPTDPSSYGTISLQDTTDPEGTTLATDTSTEETTAPLADEASGNKNTPTGTNPPETDPLATKPEETYPPETQVPETTSPAAEPLETNPPTTEPPAMNPPAADPPATSPPATDTEEETATYILNTNTMKFHWPGCRSVKDIKDENKQEFTGKRSELIAMDYQACGICHP